MSPLAKALYLARYRPTDDDSTAQLLKLATTDNKEIRPFYRWCLDFTILISDGALGEYTGMPAWNYATRFPVEFFAYMRRDKTGQRYQRWVSAIMYSGPLGPDYPIAEIKPYVTKSMLARCSSCSPATRVSISQFAADIAREQKKWK